MNPAIANLGNGCQVLVENPPFERARVVKHDRKALEAVQDMQDFQAYASCREAMRAFHDAVDAHCFAGYQTASRQRPYDGFTANRSQQTGILRTQARNKGLGKMLPVSVDHVFSLRVSQVLSDRNGKSHGA
jgi:hypothetical protein